MSISGVGQNSVIRRDMTGSVAPAPDCSMVITVGATAKDYRADVC